MAGHRPSCDNDLDPGGLFGLGVLSILERSMVSPLLPPEILVDALQDRIHPTSGRLLSAAPIAPKIGVAAERLRRAADATPLRSESDDAATALRNRHQPTATTRRLLTVVLAIVLMGGCATFERITLVAATASLVCDWSQTRSWSELGWPDGYRERNPVLGPMPATSVIDVYFLGAIVLSSAIWMRTPPGYRWLPALLVTAVQWPVVMDNERQIEARRASVDADRRVACGRSFMAVRR